MLSSFAILFLFGSAITTHFAYILFKMFFLVFVESLMEIIRL